MNETQTVENSSPQKASKELKVYSLLCCAASTIFFVVGHFKAVAVEEYARSVGRPLEGGFGFSQSFPLLIWVVGCLFAGVIGIGLVVNAIRKTTRFYTSPLIISSVILLGPFFFLVFNILFTIFG
jgi:hypothetical protein